MRNEAASRGLALTDSGFVQESERLKAFSPVESEEDIFRVLQVDFVPPEKRGEEIP